MKMDDLSYELHHERIKRSIKQQDRVEDIREIALQLLELVAQQRGAMREVLKRQLGFDKLEGSV